MNFSWKQCEGQVINNTFPLEKYLGGSAESAVFLTLLSGSAPAKAAIKLIPEGPASNLQLSLWRRAAQLSHPHLLRLLQSGRCRLADLDLLYVAMEFAEEDLSQVLPDRALTPAEARDMLGPTLSALNYLHYHGLVHTHLKPSNVLAIGDQLKLSSDTLFPVGESRKVAGPHDIYTAPEVGSLPLAAAADAWSIGVTLVEMLTQHAPDWKSSPQGEPVVPEALAQPFQEIARRTLRVDPKLRWTMAEIGACLNPVALAAAAAQSISPLAVPLSSVPAVPAAKLQAPRQVSLAPSGAPQAAAVSKPTILLPNYVLPAAAAILILAGIFVLPKILGHRVETASSSGSIPAASAPEKPTTASARPEAKAVAQPSAPSAEKASEPQSTAQETVTQTDAASPASSGPASLTTESPSVVETPKRSAVGPRGEVLDQVLPEVSEKALATIQGTVRVTLLLHIDAAGNVSEAEFESPGPSQYFANLSMTAARRWEFTSPEVNGHSVPSQWRLRFEFSQTGVQAFPRQIAP